ncbi:hypothetical protein ACGH2B_23385 [Streptomyces sp. BBFR2]|uniref:hypothetical protein n=1 Tax=Streptomyces sp. BBFR2 TaxID=3372854 RepID=UPI0037D9FD40
MAAGDLDPSFGTGGKVSIDFGAVSIANAVALQSDAKLVLAGRVGDASTGDFGVARLNRNGSLDTTFGTGGKVTLSLSAAEDVARAVAIQSDGKIVVGGFAGSEAAGNIAVVRFNPDGTLDAGFGSGGVAIYDISGPTGDAIRGMVLQPDGKILGVGAAGANAGLIRLNPDGSLDTTFAGGAGKEAVSLGNAGHLFALSLLSTGAFLVAGFDSTALTQDDFLLARFNADGSLDSTFGSSGLVRTDFNGLNDLAFAMTVQSDGKIVLGGDTDSTDPVGISGDVKAGWTRYDSAGTLDSAFGTAGKTQINPTVLCDGVRGLVLQSDGKIVAGGFIGETTGLASFADPVAGDFAVYRLNTNGTPDTTFGIGGAVRTDFAGLGDGGRAVTLQTANRIVLVGGATTNHLNFAAARYKT